MPHKRTTPNILRQLDVKKFFESVNLPYHSPHKFRHGHIQYGAAHSKTVADFKAVSMNVMHAIMDITPDPDITHNLIKMNYDMIWKGMILDIPI
jgi:hypothetical protein